MKATQFMDKRKYTNRLTPERTKYVRTHKHLRMYSIGHRENFNMFPDLLKKTSPWLDLQVKRSRISGDHGWKK